MTVTDYILSDKTAIIRMDDGKANALSYAMMDEVEAALNRAEQEASAVVITGRPGRFCAGFDLREMTKGADSARALVTRGADFLLRLYLFPKPLVVACSGHALAGGALTVLTGDLRIGAQGAFRIGLNEVQIGMPVPILAMELARDRLNPHALQEATLFARIYTPDEAVEAGYLDRVIDEATLLEEATREAARLAALPGNAYARTKTILRERTVNYVRQNLEMDMIRLTPPAAT
ncbi:MAG: crotonase/enoyl-CoA hydratase family protein [Myxococcales bacterium]|nr:crotonase/enoyl-CoA hydratase family protein [Polyangiaceae bacterium]MDW8248186.1 crotonase/enoyl-CoA hydratase family protein [Myxococcales bacterium]